MSEQGRE
jgi:hypothetical protein